MLQLICKLVVAELHSWLVVSYTGMLLPWKPKTKQRMAFRMIQIKDSPLPMGLYNMCIISWRGLLKKRQGFTSCRSYMDIGWYMDGYRMIQPVKSVAATNNHSHEAKQQTPRISYPQLVSLQKPFFIGAWWFMILNQKNLSGICVFGPSSWGNPKSAFPAQALAKKKVRPWGELLFLGEELTTTSIPVG